MTAKLIPVASHVRRAPSRPAVYIALHDQLRREVEIDRELESALREELERDPTFAFHGGLV